MAGFVKLATLDELPSGQAREVEHDGRIYALFHADGQIWAIDGICAHQGGPLAEGAMEGSTITCPWHGWQYDVRTGRALIGTRIQQATYEVRIEGRDVLVAVPGAIGEGPARAHRASERGGLSNEPAGR